MIEQPLELIDSLEFFCVADFDENPETCPACRGEIQTGILEAALVFTGLCACPSCGVMVAA